MKMYGLRVEPWNGTVKFIEIEATETKGQYHLEENPFYLKHINKSVMKYGAYADTDGWKFVGVSVESVVNLMADYYKRDIHQCNLRIERDKDLIQKAKEVAAHV